MGQENALDDFGNSYIRIVNFENNQAEKFYVRDIERAVTKNERVSISQPNSDSDEIASMKGYYDFVKSQEKCQTRN